MVVVKKSGCENRTRVSASTRLKDNHYPNPDTLARHSRPGGPEIRYDSRGGCHTLARIPLASEPTARLESGPGRFSTPIPNDH